MISLTGNTETDSRAFALIKEIKVLENKRNALSCEFKTKLASIDDEIVSSVEMLVSLEKMLSFKLIPTPDYLDLRNKCEKLKETKIAEYNKCDAEYKRRYSKYKDMLNAKLEELDKLYSLDDFYDYYDEF